MDVAQQLRLEEAVKPYVYKDSEGWLSIAIGRLVDERKGGGGLRGIEMEYMLANDIEDRRQRLTRAYPWWTTLNEPRQAVMVQMAFQLGMDGLAAFVNTLAAVKTGRYADAARGMLASRWADQATNRVKRLALQMETGSWINA